MVELAARLTRPEFPRSSRYDSDWMVANQMGPNALWLMEWLSDSLVLEPGMRVLDLGCGRAMTSVFLAKEYGAKIWAADLWIGPDHNWERAVEAGVSDRVCPMRLAAHELPFAQGFFDAVVSVDAYQYFGTDALYLSYLSGFVRPGGQIGVVVPGLMQPLDATVPAHLSEPQANGKSFWEDDCWCFQTASWWKRQWERCGKVTEVRTDTLRDGWRHWRDFDRAVEQSGRGIFPSDAEALDRDGGRYIGFVRALCSRNDEPALNLYDPSVGVRVGVDC